MTNFEWQTDSDYDWDDQPIVINSAEKSRRLPILLGITFLIILASATLYWQFRKTINTTTTAVETELTATVTLLYQASQNGDTDLMASLLSGTDEQWAKQIQLHVGDFNLLDRKEFGMQLISAEPTHTEITLSPDLLSAVVTSTIAYAIDVGNGLTETILLEQPAYFRKGKVHWLLAPFSAEYWGTRLTRDTAFGEAVYYEHDRLLIEKLLRDLNLAFVRQCANRDDILCTEPQIHLNFSIAPPITALRTSQTGQLLPTPTLLGLPTDRISYQALLNGYAKIILPQP